MLVSNQENLNGGSLIIGDVWDQFPFCFIILTEGSNGFKRVERFFDQIRHKQQVKDTNSEFSIRKNKQLINSTSNFTVQVPPTNITFQWINILLIVVKKT